MNLKVMRCRYCTYVWRPFLWVCSVTDNEFRFVITLVKLTADGLVDPQLL